MIGKQIGEIKGKATGQRVLDADAPAMETSVTASGNFGGSPVNVILTYTSKLVTKGVLHGWGNGVMMTPEGDVASYTGEAIGKIDSSGSISWRGSLFYNSSASGKLASLRNVVAVLEAEVSAQGNFIEKTWEGN
ncbi:MAG TPA: hypothetical protein VH415_13825 [Nitrososphaeraceae archaeon]|jgi:hypothetical protein